MASGQGSAASRAKKAREREIQADLDKTQAHLANLQRQRAGLEEALRQNDAAQHQMLGRMRKDQEDLGIVEPLADPPPAPEEMGDEEPEPEE